MSEPATSPSDLEQLRRALAAIRSLRAKVEALEDAAILPASLEGTRTGVFVGVMNEDWSRLLALRGAPEDADAYVGTGSDISFLAGRLSYVLGLQGPSVVLATACSSSLVALHLAAQSLRARECRVALAGGVSLILSPDTNVILSKMHALSPDGRCKTFDAAADGYGRGEGCGVLVLILVRFQVETNDPWPCCQAS